LIEVKTDSNSRDHIQDENLTLVTQHGAEEIFNDIQIMAKTKVKRYRVKYEHLLKKLEEFKLFDTDHKYIGKKGEIFEFRYLQPKILPKDEGKEANIIVFDTFFQWLNRDGADDFEKSFSAALKLWTND
jgi:hypothetical protein